MRNSFMTLSTKKKGKRLHALYILGSISMTRNWKQRTIRFTALLEFRYRKLLQMFRGVEPENSSVELTFRSDFLLYQ